MANEQSQEQQAVAASFAEHIRSFHASLPPEEQALLEQVFALAAQGAEQGDTAGFAFDAFMKLGLTNQQITRPFSWEMKFAKVEQAYKLFGEASPPDKSH